MTGANPGGGGVFGVLRDPPLKVEPQAGNPGEKARRKATMRKD